MTGEERRTRRWVLERLGVGSAAVGLASLSGCSSFREESRGSKRRDGYPGGESATEGPDRDPDRAPTSEGGSQTPSAGPGVGVYLGDDTKLDQWEEWFRRPLDYYSIALFNENWEDYVVDNWPVEVDLESIAKKYRVIVTFKMFPRGERLRSVAAGRFNTRYRALAADLVANQLSDAYLRFGSEFNGRWATATAVGRPDLFVKAWKQVVTSMRSVDGAAFDFVWAPNVWRYHMNPVRAYPGDGWVDAVGLTVYDKGQYYPFPENCNRKCVQERRRRTWENIVNGRQAGFGLDFWANFARGHDKPLVFPEYGPVARNAPNPGGGDNPMFFDNFYRWMQSNRDVVDWHTPWAWTAGPHFVGPPELKHESAYPALPRASEAFRRLFGGE